jgi:uncharacterized protein (DUF58 family)
MRGGRSGLEGQPATKLEHGLRMAMGLAQQISAGGDRVGLITFDEKIHGHMRPRDGKRHLSQVVQHLIGTRHIIDEDLTEYTEQEVAELLARYLMIQERLDFRRKPGRAHKGVGQGLDYWSFSRELVEPDQSLYDMQLLEQWVGAALEDEEEKFGDLCLHTGVPGYEHASALRRFCHLRGVELPYRVEARLGQKERGLAQCIEEILAHARDAHTVVIISDLCGIMNTELLSRGLRAARARRHRLAFVSPFTPDYTQVPQGRGQMLHELFSLAEAEDRSSVIKTIQSQSIPVVPLAPHDSLGYVLRNLGL